MRLSNSRILFLRNLGKWDLPDEPRDACSIYVVFHFYNKTLHLYVFKSRYIFIFILHTTIFLLLFLTLPLLFILSMTPSVTDSNRYTLPLYLWISLSLSLPPSLFLSLYLSLPLCLFISLPLCFFLFQSLIFSPSRLLPVVT